jgi:hypothetical protein
MDDSAADAQNEAKFGPEMSVARFFESVPPGGRARVVKPAIKSAGGGSTLSFHLELPDLRLHCGTDGCDGVRNFHAPHPLTVRLVANSPGQEFVVYVCRNCRQTLKHYAIRWDCIGAPDEAEVRLFKYGEAPPFGPPPTPSRLTTIIGQERDIFLKGRRCEAQGLGIGAFVYYRRVIENQKSRLLEAIVKASKRLGASGALVEDLEAAKAESRFADSVRRIHHALPDQFLIRGHNPLSLLHAALSEGLHAQSDEDCLSSASAVRTVLAELATRLSEALEDQTELEAAVARLLPRGKPPA